MENVQENQDFTPNEVAGVLVSLAFYGLLGLYLSLGLFQDFRGSSAQQDMRQLSRQLVSFEAQGEAKESKVFPGAERGLASVEVLGPEGKLSKDPWGQPYSYKFLENSGNVYAVIIWTKGPNGEGELSNEHLLRGPSGRIVRVLGAGDDLFHFENIH